MDSIESNKLTLNLTNKVVPLASECPIKLLEQVKIYIFLFLTQFTVISQPQKLIFQLEALFHSSNTRLFMKL